MEDYRAQVATLSLNFLLYFVTSYTPTYIPTETHTDARPFHGLAMTDETPPWRIITRRRSVFTTNGFFRFAIVRLMV